MTTNIYTRLFAIITGALLLVNSHAFGVTRTSAASGSWSSSSTWSPSGVPAATDNIIVATGTTVTVDTNVTTTQIMVGAGGTLTFVAGKKLILLGAIIVNGTVNMNGADIAMLVPNSSFTLGANSTFTWNPATNNAANATLFTNGTENFAPTSTLIIKKWYNYTTLPLGTVVTGNFGNLVINTNSSGSILEWNQNNQFETHQVLGTLTVDQGWVTLDKSGSISNTTIGNIVLTSANSYFTAYSGTAAPNFTLNTSSISNSGGTFFGIYDGKGNITLNVSGNFTTSGNVKLIDNDGLNGTGMCNGNATFIIGGTFSQSTGDTRLIYNLYTTNSGTYNAQIGTLNVSGGIFMGQYSCHTAGATSTFKVANCTLSLPNNTDKFRCIGMSGISTYVNNQQLTLSAGNLTISGNAAAEFTTSASAGNETDSITGNFQVNSCLNSFNYGSSTAAHNTALTIGNLAISGGTTYLSRIPGKLTSTVNGNFTLSNGTVIVKGDVGTAALVVKGTFNQSGGKFYHHSNYSTPTADVVSVTLNGDFNQSAGSLTFDDCSSSTAVHTLMIDGKNYNLSGTGTITRAGSSVFSEIHYGYNGITQFNRSGNSHRVLQTKQYIDNGCTLNVNQGNIQLASGSNASDYFMTVSTGGVLNMNSQQLFSNGAGAYSAIMIDSAAILKTANIYGLYDGSVNACINSSGQLTYYLDLNSVVEFNGTGNQVITEGNPAQQPPVNEQYGILMINSNGTSNYTYLSSNVVVRTRLVLLNGELDLNGYGLTIASGLSNAIARLSGYIKSETNTPYNSSIMTWQNLSTGLYVFPFGKDANSYLPVTFNALSGSGNVSVSTRATLTSDNTPLPLTTTSDSSAVALNLSYAENYVIDRWWVINAPGFTANVTLSYLGSENTMNDTSATGNLYIKQWNGSLWNNGLTLDKGVTSGIGTVTLNNANLFSAWMIAGQPSTPSVPILTNPGLGGNGGNLSMQIQTILPNPFNDKFNFNYTLDKGGPVTIQITDMNGKMVHNEVVSGAAGANVYTFNDIYNLRSGVYFFSVTYQGNTTTKKIVKS